MYISMIAAVSLNAVIGVDNKLPWHLPKDLARFKELTLNNTVIMGRNTYESLPIRPLPNRQNIVVTRNLNYSAPGCVVASDIEDALDAASHPIFIIGGASLYAQTLYLANDLYLTEVATTIHPAKSCVTFPYYDPNDWVIQSRDEHVDDTGLAYAFVHRLRVRKNQDASTHYPFSAKLLD